MNATLNSNGNVEPGRVKHDGAAPRAYFPANHDGLPIHAAPHGGGRKPNQTRPEGGKQRGWPGIIFTLVTVAAAIVAAVLWRRSFAFETLASETRAMAVPAVATVLPQSGPAETEIVLPGNLMAYSEASIYARTNGYVKAWYTDIGAKVKEGELMAEIEAPDVDAQLRQAVSNLAQARANLEIATLTFAREKDLLQKNVISQEEFDQSRTTMAAQDAAVKAGEANVQDLQVQQGFQKITAPFDGVVTRRSTDVGVLINAGSNTNSPSGLELFHVARTDILRVFIYVPQVYSSLLKLDSPAYLELAEHPGVKFQGKIAHIAGAIDPASRTLLTEVQVPNEDGRLFPGAFANVHLLLRFDHAPAVVPVNSMLFRAQGAQVAVVDNSGTVHLKNVTVGRDFGTSLEVTSGVGAYDRVIVNPSDSLADGAKVEVQNAPAAASAK